MRRSDGDCRELDSDALPAEERRPRWRTDLQVVAVACTMEGIPLSVHARGVRPEISANDLGAHTVAYG